MADPRRVRVEGNLYHGRAPDGAVYVGRAAPGLRSLMWGNPHRVGKPCGGCQARHGEPVIHDQGTAVLHYGLDLRDSPVTVSLARQDLAGRDLACWCPFNIPCHGDVLLRVAAGMDPLSALAHVLMPALLVTNPAAVGDPNQVPVVDLTPAALDLILIQKERTL